MKKRNNKFEYNVKLVPLTLSNKDQNAFRDELNNIPYLLYEVEKLSSGEIIAINKPGGKRNFGRLSRNDFMVFIYTPRENTLWLISHKELLEDLEEKFAQDEMQAILLIKGLYHVCCGEEPDNVIAKLQLKDTVGIPVETILKVYKWIWGQEDCNYPTKQGRWLSMNGLLERFGVKKEDCKNGKKNN